MSKAKLAKAKFAKANVAEAELAKAKLAKATFVKAKSSNAKLMILSYEHFQLGSCWDNIYVYLYALWCYS